MQPPRPSRRREAPSDDRNATEVEMTDREKEPLSRTEQLENIVDALDEKVAGERGPQGVPGKPGDRAHVEVLGSEKEPPV
jgi:hypothetical protein